MITNLSYENALVSCWISELRDTTIQTRRERFRHNLARIGEVAAYEISRRLPYRQQAVQTPLGIANCSVLAVQPVIATILRAGLPLFEGLLRYFDHADAAFIGAYRQHAADGSFAIHQQYVANPVLAGRPLIVADSMLATGASLVLAIKTLIEQDEPAELHIVTAIAAIQGIEHVQYHFPQAHIWAGAIDNELSDKGYIMPGLGDAGDLAYGQKKQC